MLVGRYTVHENSNSVSPELVPIQANAQSFIKGRLLHVHVHGELAKAKDSAYSG